MAILDKKFFKDLNLWTGYTVAVGFCLFVLAALLSYPGAFSPLDDAMSDLGNSMLNPAGNVFFNLGCIVTGVLLAFFFFGLGVWYTGDKKQDYMIIAAQALGILSAMALVFVGMYSEDRMDMHVLAATTYFAIQAIMLPFAGYVLYRHPLFQKWLARFGALLTLIIIVMCLGFVLNMNLIILEWVAVFGGIAWVLGMTLNAKKIPLPVKEEPKKEDGVSQA